MQELINFKDVLLKYYNDEELMFKVGIGLKFLVVSGFCAFSVLFFTYLLIRVDLIFFTAHGFPGALLFQEAFYDSIYSSFSSEMLWSIPLSIFIFGLGFYLSGVMMRPFKTISRYCEDKMQGLNVEYSPDFFSDLKLLTSFSVFFFSKIEEAHLEKKMEEVVIPPVYTRIHKPHFEKNYFLNYFFIIVIFGLISSAAIVYLNLQIRDQVLDLAKKLLSSNKQATYFLNEQFIIADIGIYFLTLFHLILYFLLGIHLYTKISTPAFAIFATMRSFLRGSYHNRVHIIGYSYLRKDCRVINRYLAYVQESLTKKL